MEVSSRLLSEVLEIDNLLEGEPFNIKVEGAVYFETQYGEDRINTYELAHKCKEWAYWKDYDLFSFTRDDHWNCRCINNITDGYDFESEWWHTEPEAIFKACEWILDNKGVR